MTFFCSLHQNNLVCDILLSFWEGQGVQNLLFVSSFPTRDCYRETCCSQGRCRQTPCSVMSHNKGGVWRTCICYFHVFFENFWCSNYQMSSKSTSFSNYSSFHGRYPSFLVQWSSYLNYYIYTSGVLPSHLSPVIFAILLRVVQIFWTCVLV